MIHFLDFLHKHPGLWKKTPPGFIITLIVTFVIADLSMMTTFIAAVWSPRFLFQASWKLYLSLIPLAVVILCRLAIICFLIGVPPSFDVFAIMGYASLLLPILALIAMLRPRSGNILTRCFVPFIEDEPKSITA